MAGEEKKEWEVKWLKETAWVERATSGVKG